MRWEGGSAYWCCYANCDLTPEAEAARDKIQQERREATGDGTYYSHELAFLPGATVLLTDREAEEPGPFTLTLNREKLIAGLQVMASKYPRHFANFMSENDDAETGDVYLQCCLFGEIVYG